jgi:hypothetical protein
MCYDLILFEVKSGRTKKKYIKRSTEAQKHCYSSNSGCDTSRRRNYKKEKKNPMKISSCLNAIFDTWN